MLKLIEGYHLGIEHPRPQKSVEAGRTVQLCEVQSRDESVEGRFWPGPGDTASVSIEFMDGRPLRS